MKSNFIWTFLKDFYFSKVTGLWLKNEPAMPISYLTEITYESANFIGKTPSLFHKLTLWVKIDKSRLNHMEYFFP